MHHHHLRRVRVSVFLVSGCLAGLAGAQTPVTAANPSADFGPKTQVNDPCLKEVSKFEQTIGFLRHSQGASAAASLKEKLLPAKLEADLLFKEGYCGLAKYLRERKLID
jgi:hypothetical protein